MNMIPVRRENMLFNNNLDCFLWAKEALELIIPLTSHIHLGHL